jgi:hypothetical protein
VSAQSANGGPFGPFNGTLTVGLSVPADCTKVPSGTQSIAQVIGSPALFSPSWLVNCSNPSNHQFDGTANLAVTLPLHVTDSNSENNSGAGSDTTAVLSVQDKDSRPCRPAGAGADLDGILWKTAAPRPATATTTR